MDDVIQDNRGVAEYQGGSCATQRTLVMLCFHAIVTWVFPDNALMLSSLQWMICISDGGRRCDESFHWRAGPQVHYCWGTGLMFLVWESFYNVFRCSSAKRRCVRLYSVKNRNDVTPLVGCLFYFWVSISGALTRTQRSVLQIESGRVCANMCQCCPPRLFHFCTQKLGYQHFYRHW